MAPSVSAIRVSNSSSPSELYAQNDCKQTPVCCQDSLLKKLRYYSCQHRYIHFSLCTFALIVTFGLYGYLLERFTIDRKGPNEFCLMFICCSLYCFLSYCGKKCFNEENSKVPAIIFIALSLSTFASSYTSMRALRHVSYPMKILGKTCKPIAIVIFGKILGRSFSCRKYISVFLIVVGAFIFFISKSNTSSVEQKDSLKGMFLLTISLGFDGLTGALEDKYMNQYHFGPFTMMYHMNMYSSLLSFIVIILTNAQREFVLLIVSQNSSINLLLLGLSGGFGQIVIFIMLSFYGSMLTSVSGTLRKILTMSASIYLFGHMLNSSQVCGLFITVAGLFLNLYRPSKNNVSKPHDEIEQVGLLGGPSDLYEDDLCDCRNPTINAVDINSVKSRLRKLNVGEELPSSEFSDGACLDLDVVFAEEDEKTYSLDVDAAFRATTAV